MSLLPSPSPRQAWLPLTGRWVHLESGEVRGHGWRARLTTRELQLLRHLAARPAEDVARDDLLREAFGYARGAQSRAVDKAMDSLRAKVEVDRRLPLHLLTVHGHGYRFVPLSAWEAP